MKKYIGFALICALFSCNSEPKEQKSEAPDLSKIKRMEWVLGTWESSTPEGNITEIWKKVDDSTFNGTSVMLKEKDTIYSESTILEQRMGGMYYIVRVKGQNNGVATSFENIPGSDDEVIFEDPDHNYPRRIIYKSLPPDTLVARLEGKENGKERSEEFRMVRIKK